MREYKNSAQEQRLGRGRPCPCPWSQGITDHLNFEHFLPVPALTKLLLVSPGGYSQIRAIGIDIGRLLVDAYESG